jgi:hypothetical protein
VRRVFLFSGYRLKVFEWHGKYLLGTCEFEPDEEGMNSFKRYLRAAVPMPVQFLVDVIEEDFRRESIPHVNSRDRKALVARLLDRFYRGYHYQHVEYIGRNKEGRKDDLVLISSLTNNELFSPWMSLIQEEKTPLAGIWSLPLLSASLLPLVTKKEENVLLISRQVPSALRESYFQKGKMVLSRQEKLDRYTTEHEGNEVALKSLHKGTDQIYHFLTNQRIMGFNDTLNVYSVLPTQQLERARTLNEDGRVIKYHFYDLQQLFDHFKLGNCRQENADTLHSYLCAKENLFSDHYSVREFKYSFYRHLIDKSITLTATLGAILAMTVAVLLWLNTKDLALRTKTIEISRLVLMQRYEKDFAPRIEQLADAAKVQKTVELANRLDKEANYRLQAFFEPLSKVFSDPQFAMLHLDSIKWTKYVPSVLQELARTNQLAVTEPPDPQAQVYEEPVTEDQSVALPYQAALSLTGMFNRKSTANTNMSYTQVVNTMTLFEKALSAVEGVQQVQMKRVPVDIRPGVQFDDNGGVKLLEDKKNDEANQFEIFIILEPPPHELEQSIHE